MPREHIFKGQLQMLSVSTDLFSCSAAHATDGSVGTTQGPLYGFSLRVIMK